MMDKNELGMILYNVRDINKRTQKIDIKQRNEARQESLKYCKKEAEAIINYLKSNLQISSNEFEILSNGNQVK